MEETLCFCDQNFLAVHPLSPENIISYFSLSPFYDKNCVNEILKMQSQFTSIDISHKLTSLPGVFYILEHSAQDLFVIAKKHNNGEKTTTLKMYYCMAGYIYCSPTIGSVSDSRICEVLLHLSEALNWREEAKTFDWKEGLQYRQKEEDDDAAQEDTKFVMEALHDFEVKQGKE